MRRTFAFLLSFLMLSSLFIAAPTASAEAPEGFPKNVTVAQPDTNIIGEISVIREINSAEELESLAAASRKPAVAIYRIDEDLNVLDDKEVAFSTVVRVIRKTSFSVLPAFYITNNAQAEALQAFLMEKNFYDCLIISHKTNLIQEFREQLPSVGAVIDFSKKYGGEAELTREMMLDIRTRMNKYCGTIALLPSQLCTKEAVEYLYHRQVNVWSALPAEASKSEQYDAILSGAIGVVSDQTESLFEIVCDELPYNTMTRMPLNVGHRAIPSKAPENTVEGALLAYEYGAQVIEIDVYLTTDGEVVLMHDSTTGRTCNKNIGVEISTLAQLKELYVNKGFENHADYKECRIPTLQEMLAAFQDTDCRFFIEIKSGKTEIVPLIKAIVEEADMYSQCTVITFNTGIMAAMREEYPEMSLSALTSNHPMKGDTAEADLRNVMDFIGPYNAAYSPSQNTVDDMSQRAAIHRGISIYAWTFSGSINAYNNAFFWGYTGLTGNDAHLFENIVRAVELPEDTITPVMNKPIPLAPILTHYAKEDTPADLASITVISGEDIVNVDGLSVTFTDYGEVTLLIGYNTHLAIGTSYTVFSQPITLSLPEPEIETEADTEIQQETETDATDVPTQTGQKRNPLPAIVAGSAGILIAAGVIVAVILIKKRRA